ncbi:nucleotidyltransferase domain-containing protein [Thermodesulfobacteriota bacterium]
MQKTNIKNIRNSLLEAASDIFAKHPVLFAYLYGGFAIGLVHPFSDLDIGIYIEDLPHKKSLELELSLSLEIDKNIGSGVTSEVRIINTLPLTVTGNIITEGDLIYSRNEVVRVDFETSVRSAYFDFLPIIQQYQRAYIDSI